METFDGKKTNDYNIAKLAKNIIQTQTDEIRDMRELLKNNIFIYFYII
jgi:uncharacterized protein (DUF305 family)